MWDAQQLYNTRFHQECQQFFQYFFVLFAERVFTVFLGQNQLILTSQSASQTAPLPRGASGEEGKFSGMPKPPLDRSNDDDRRQWRKQGIVVGAAASKTQAKRSGCWVPQPGQWHAVRRDGEVKSLGIRKTSDNSSLARPRGWGGRGPAGGLRSGAADGGRPWRRSGAS